MSKLDDDPEAIADIVQLLFELERDDLISIKATHLELHDYLNDRLILEPAMARDQEAD